jgi:hypothetical protein
MSYSGIPYQTLTEHLSSDIYTVNHDGIEWTPDESWNKDECDHYLLPLHALHGNYNIFGDRLIMVIDARVYFEYKNKPIGGWVSYTIGFTDHDKSWEVHEGDVDFDKKWLTTDQIGKLILKQIKKFTSAVGSAEFEIRSQ